MEAQKQFRLPEGNLETAAQHRKEVFWQITFPFILALLVILALTGGVIWAAVGGNDQLSQWADTSVIWLIIPPIIFSLIILALTAGMLVGVVKLIQVLPGAMHLVQTYFIMAEHRVKQVTNKIVEPVLKIQSFFAGAGALKRKKNL